MHLSIVIVNWNTRQLLADCLRSLRADFERGAGLWEVFVVDNASSDGSREMLAGEFPWVRCIHNPRNSGFAAANNLALQQASGAYLLLLNADTRVRAGALDVLTGYMDIHPEVGAAGPRLVNPDGSLQPSCYPEPTLGREFWRMFHLDRLHPLGIYDMPRWPQSQARCVDDIMGACMLLRREAIDQVGLLDESFFMYSEEIDWCRRIRLAGWRICWVPQAEIVHLGGQSTRQSRREMFFQLYRSKIMYFRKHYGLRRARAYKAILAAAALWRLAFSWLAYLQKPPARGESLLLTGYYRQLLLRLPGM